MAATTWGNTGLTALALAVTLSSTGADWPRFRGPAGAALSSEGNLPTTWSEDSGLVWKTKLPGPGASSPITSGDRVFLTCYSGYGVDRAEGTLEDLTRHLVCLDRRTGEILWQQAIPAKLPEDPFRAPGVATHGYASSTPVTDGEQVYVFFGKSGALAFDSAGNQIWHADLGSGSFGRFGSAASPIIYKNALIVNATVESESIVALDKRNGNELWKASSEGYGGSFSTPILVDVDDQQELVINVADEVWGLNPDTGKLRWFAVTNLGSTICPSLVAADGTVFALGGSPRSRGAVAIRAGGTGDVSESHVLWQSNVGSYVTSPVIYGGNLYWVSDGDIAYCLDAKSGELLYEERLGGRSVYASLVVGDGKLYAVSRQNGTFVLPAGPDFEVLAHNEFASDRSTFNASPAISDGHLFLRSDEYVYCIGKSE